MQQFSNVPQPCEYDRPTFFNVKDCFHNGPISFFFFLLELLYCFISITLFIKLISDSFCDHYPITHQQVLR